MYCPNRSNAFCEDKDMKIIVGPHAVLTKESTKLEKLNWQCFNCKTTVIDESGLLFRGGLHPNLYSK